MVTDETSAGARLPGEDPEFQEASWRIQRWMRGGLFAVVFLAIGGTFGDSPWLDRETRAGSFEAKYPYLVRQKSAMEWRFALGGSPELWFDHPLIDSFDIELVLPDPAAKSSDDRRIVFRFAPGTEDVRIRLRPRKWGKLAGEAGSGEGRVGMTMWGWP